MTYDHERRVMAQVLRGFQFTNGVLQSASMNEEVTDMNRATIEYTKYVNNDDEIDFWIPV